MARLIDRKEAPKNPYMELARMEDVSQEELMKKYMEEVKERGVEERTDEDIRKEEEQFQAMEMMAFLGLEDVELDMDNNPLAQLTEMCAESYKDTILASHDDPEYQKLVKELNRKQGIEEMDMSQNWTNVDDPLLIKQFEAESEKIVATLAARRKRKKIDKNTTMKELNAAYALEEEIANSFRDRSSSDSSYSEPSYRSSSGFRNSSIFEDSRSSESSGFRSTSAKSETTEFKQSVFNNEEREKQRRHMYAAASGKMMDMAYNGAKKEKKPRKHSRFGGKKKFSFRGMVQSAKDWFNTDEATLMMKIGTMLCLETGLAIITKKYEFDGPLQAVSFIGMMLGIFYVGREVRSEGFDARRISLL